MLCLCLIFLTILFIISSILFFPTIKIGPVRLASYWVIAFLCAILLFLFKQVSWESIINSFTTNTSVNPIKILVLFISMTILSIFLDEIGFFRYVALKATKWVKGSQIKLFLAYTLLFLFLQCLLQMTLSF